MDDTLKMALATQILSRPARTWANRKRQIEAALSIDEPTASDEAIELMEREAKVLLGSYRE